MSVTFNSTTPAAPAGNRNITWQKDGSGNVSGYVKNGAGARATYAVTTASLANGAIETGTMTLEKAFMALKIVVSGYARVRLYSTAAAATADVARPFTTPPAIGTQHEVILDSQLDSVYGSTTFILSPAAIGANMETVPSTSISYNITNLSGSTGAVTVTITAIPLE